MKKCLLIALIFGVALIVLPGKAQAQYNPFIYSNNAYLSYALAKRKARAKAKSKKVVRKTAAKRKPVRRTRRVSSLEITNDPRNAVNGLYSKKSEII